MLEMLLAQLKMHEKSDEVACFNQVASIIFQQITCYLIFFNNRKQWEKEKEKVQ
jgi:hypothetical protein